MSWDDNLAATDALVAGYFDTQEFTAIAAAKPGLDVNARDQADSSRPSFTFMGTLETDPMLNDVGTTERANSRTDGARNVHRQCLTALSTNWPWMLKQGDFVARGGKLFKLAQSPDRDGTDRVVLWLNSVRT